MRRDRCGIWIELSIADVAVRMRWMEPGSFVMGSPPGEAGRWDNEGPQRRVDVGSGFWLAETACTQELWFAVTGATPSRFQSPQRPVERISAADCLEFLAAINERHPDLRTRLPSEAEWEYACRAGSETSTYAGDLQFRGSRDATLLHDIAWYSGNSGVQFELAGGVDSSRWEGKEFEHSRAGTHPVGQKQPNAWGLYDMLGNVLEWCAGSYQESIEPARSELRVLRGGSWIDQPRFCRGGFRIGLDPHLRVGNIGFRFASDLVGPAGAAGTNSDASVTARG